MNTAPETEAKIRDKHILVAVDQSESSKRAVLYVADFVGGFPGFTVTLLSIISEPSEDFFETDDERKIWISNTTEKSVKLLEKYRQILIQSGFPEEKVKTRVCVDAPGSLSELILSFQCGLNCCTVVVGRHHKSKTEEFLFGSTSSQIIHDAKNCAIWVVE
ncbi:MAG: universal stress protein [Nitrospirae bacterium]|nr:universal stress protein [Nitrospirota bacterium]